MVLLMNLKILKEFVTLCSLSVPCPKAQALSFACAVPTSASLQYGILHSLKSSAHVHWRLLVMKK